ncbi:unnamed protein product, partial [Arabidopsis halleri]
SQSCDFSYQKFSPTKTFDSDHNLLFPSHISHHRAPSKPYLSLSTLQILFP